MTTKKATKMHLHEKRGVTISELGALLGVRALLAGGHITMHRPTSDEKRMGYIEPKHGEHGFRMQMWYTTGHCGSVGCIGGYMETLMGTQLTESLQSNLHELFYPSIPQSEWRKITPAVAVKAIDNWLKDGNPRWDRIVRVTAAKYPK